MCSALTLSHRLARLPSCQPTALPERGPCPSPSLLGSSPFPGAALNQLRRDHFPAPAGSLRVTGLHWPPKLPAGIRLDAPRGTCMSTCFPPWAHPFPGSPSISSQASCSPWNSYLQIHPGTAPTHCSPPPPTRSRWLPARSPHSAIIPKQGGDPTNCREAHTISKAAPDTPQVTRIQ